ncbi:MAG: sigma-70 family RNA polymerase sigma factor [Oscillospiraceae bacterium]|nr:sigma-70 family RNA polymerase sigma factor [Oscillospiraceae bacterium]
MTDIEILDLYEKRCQSAIDETAKRYGAYCTAIAMNILKNREDAEECVNDAYLNVWNTIPPNRPAIFSSFIGRITRNVSLNKYKSRKVQKRSGDETALLLSELNDCVPAVSSVESEVDMRVLEKAIDEFLSGVSKNDRLFFMRRYWYNDSVLSIAERFSVSESKVTSSLFRTRKKLKIHLEKEGIS